MPSDEELVTMIEFAKGFACWDWVSNVWDYPFDNDGYSVYPKPACTVIKKAYE